MGRSGAYFTPYTDIRNQSQYAIHAEREWRIRRRGAFLRRIESATPDRGFILEPGRKFARAQSFLKPKYNTEIPSREVFVRRRALGGSENAGPRWISKATPNAVSPRNRNNVIGVARYAISATPISKRIGGKPRRPNGPGRGTTRIPTAPQETTPIPLRIGLNISNAHGIFISRDKFAKFREVAPKIGKMPQRPAKRRPKSP